MRKNNKTRVLLATLLALVLLLCSFPVYAKNMNTEIPTEEMIPEAMAEAASGTSEAAESNPEEMPAAPETTEVIPEEEPAAPETPEAVPEEEPAAPETPEVVPEEEPATPETPEVVPEEEPAVPEAPEVVPEEEPAAPETPEVVPEEEPVTPETPEVVPEEEPAAPETPEVVPEEEPAAPETPEVVPEEEPEFPDNRKEEAEDIFCYFDDDDPGSVSPDLLDLINNPDAYQKLDFTGVVEIGIKNSIIAYDRDVTLVASISGAELPDYLMIWEASDDEGSSWQAVAAGSEYTYVLTRENVDREFRVVLYTTC